MRKNDELSEIRIDDKKKDLFDLSLDDLEPEDTVEKADVENADEEIIELLDLVEKGDIKLREEEETSTLVDIAKKPSEYPSDDIKIDQDMMDLLEIPVDQDLEFDPLEEGNKPTEVIDEADLEKGDKDNFDIDIEKLLQTGQVYDPDKTVRFFEEDVETPENAEEITPEESGPPIDFEPLKIEAYQEPAPEKEEPPRTSFSDEKIIGISEEKIEAIVREVVGDVVERVARETMANVAEKLITEAISALKKSLESASD